MILAVLAVIFSLVLLIWSANRFINGSAAAAHHLGMPPLLIGMVIVGFGTSSPELFVSALAAWQNNPGIALGNVFGSNILNIGFILGLTALVSPIAVSSSVLRKELLVLLLVTGLTALLLWDALLSRTDAGILLGIFATLAGWVILQGLRLHKEVLVSAKEHILDGQAEMSPSKALAWIVLGLVLLVAASRILVWGAVEIARDLGVSDLFIGLTIVAAGTSLPELASSLAAVRKGAHDLALGNILGSNLFNTLAIVGIAGTIHPLAAPPEILSRDIFVTMALTLSLFVLGFRRRGPGRINRWEGGLLMACYCGYTAFLISTA